MLKNLPATFQAKSFIGAAILFSLVILSGQFALAQQSSKTKPADWHQSDWVKFFESAVLILVDKTYGAAGANVNPVFGGKLPLVDIYSALSAIGGSTKAGLQLWLTKKITDAETAEDWKRADRYDAFLVCLTHGNCDVLQELQHNIEQAQAEVQEDESEKNEERTVSRGEATWTGKWAGTWLAYNDRIVYTVSSGDGWVLSGKFEYNFPSDYWGHAKGSGSFSNCGVQGNEATCDFNQSHEDDDKTADISGKLKLTLSGDSLTSSYSGAKVSHSFKPKRNQNMGDVERLKSAGTTLTRLK